MSPIVTSKSEYTTTLVASPSKASEIQLCRSVSLCHDVG